LIEKKKLGFPYIKEEKKPDGEFLAKESIPFKKAEGITSP